MSFVCPMENLFGHNTKKEKKSELVDLTILSPTTPDFEVFNAIQNLVTVGIATNLTGLIYL